MPSRIQSGALGANPILPAGVVDAVSRMSRTSTVVAFIWDSVAVGLAMVMLGNITSIAETAAIFVYLEMILLHLAIYHRLMDEHLRSHLDCISASIPARAFEIRAEWGITRGAASGLPGRFVLMKCTFCVAFERRSCKVDGTQTCGWPIASIELGQTTATKPSPPLYDCSATKLESGTNMPSIDFDIEKLAFRDFYDERRDALHASLTSFQTLISSLLQGQPVAGSSVEGRLKDREESGGCRPETRIIPG